MAQNSTPSRRSPTLTATIAALAAMLLAGCMRPTPVYYMVAEPEEVLVPCEPPPPRLEVPPEPPSTTCVWQAGYYNWDDEEWSWVDGTWVEPQPGYVYVEPSVVFVGGSWRFRRPYWRHHRGGRPGHHPGHPGRSGVVAGGPGGKAGPAGPHAHRAPPAHPAKHRAPKAGPPDEALAKHRAPPHQPAHDPDRPGVQAPPRALPPAQDAPGQLPPHAPVDQITRRGAGEAGEADGAEAINPLPETNEPLPRPESIRIAAETTPDQAEAGEDVTDIHAEEAEAAATDRVHEAALRQRPEFRGTRGDRMAFGDDPDRVRPRVQPLEALPARTYTTDETGAIILATPSDGPLGAVRVRGGHYESPRVIVVNNERPGRTFSEAHGDRPPPHRMMRPWPNQVAARHELMRRPQWRPMPRQPVMHAPPRMVRPEPSQRYHTPPRRFSHVSPVHRVAHRPQQVRAPRYNAPPVHRPAPSHRPAHVRASAPGRSSGPSRAPMVRMGGGGGRRGR